MGGRKVPGSRSGSTPAARARNHKLLGTGGPTLAAVHVVRSGRQQRRHPFCPNRVERESGTCRHLLLLALGTRSSGGSGVEV